MMPLILRSLTFAGALFGAAAFSQFPEFSQQYMQRLGGAVDALGEVTADFDASATAVGLSRSAALEQLRGATFLERRRVDMTRTFARYERMRADLAVLEGAGPFMRAYRLPHLTDPQIARAAWAVYQPAVPLNFAGVIFAGVGFVLGWIVFGILLRLLFWPFRRTASAA